MSRTLTAVEEEEMSTIAHFEEEVQEVLFALLDKEMKVESYRFLKNVNEFSSNTLGFCTDCKSAFHQSH